MYLQSETDRHLATAGQFARNIDLRCIPYDDFGYYLHAAFCAYDGHAASVAAKGIHEFLFDNHDDVSQLANKQEFHALCARLDALRRETARAKKTLVGARF